VSLQERSGVLTIKGNPAVVLGPELSVGDAAPDFRAVNGEFQPVALAACKGKVVLISAVPSLDTGVCAAQTKRFNQEAANLPDDVVVVTISMDLPFAQGRFCEAEKVDAIQMLSDHVWREFGTGYGILIQDMGLLARTLVVVGKDGRIAHLQIVPELTDHPDYDAALGAAREAAG